MSNIISYSNMNSIQTGQSVITYKNSDSIKVNQKKQETISLKVTSEMKQNLKRKAEAENQTLSAYMVSRAIGTGESQKMLVYRAEILGILETIKVCTDNNKQVVQLTDEIAEMIKE